MTERTSDRADIYTRVTQKIIADLENGVRTWLKPWNADHIAGRISRPLRANGTPYKGINVIMLWASAVEQGFGCPIWMTYRQAQGIGAQVRKGERGTLVVYADRIKKSEVDEETGEASEREIPFMKGYTVFNCEQIDGLPPHYLAPAAAPPALSPLQRIERAESVLCRDQRRHPPWRKPGLLRHSPRLCAAAAVRGLPRCRELLHHPRP